MTLEERIHEAAKNGHTITIQSLPAISSGAPLNLSQPIRVSIRAVKTVGLGRVVYETSVTSPSISDALDEIQARINESGSLSI